METLTPKDIVEAYLDASIHHDYRRARACLADESFLYVAPINRFQSADDFIAYAELASPVVQRVEICKVFVDDNDVYHILEITSQISEKRANRLAMWARVEGFRIKRLEMIFDAHEYRNLFVVEE
ncbi:MAG: hypothetical protein ACOY4D_12820 [Pseudomonadota bacterium]